MPDSKDSKPEPKPDIVRGTVELFGAAIPVAPIRHIPMSNELDQYETFLYEAYLGSTIIAERDNRQRANQ